MTWQSDHDGQQATDALGNSSQKPEVGQTGSDGSHCSGTATPRMCLTDPLCGAVSDF